MNKKMVIKHIRMFGSSWGGWGTWLETRDKGRGGGGRVIQQERRLHRPVMIMHHKVRCINNSTICI